MTEEQITLAAREICAEQAQKQDNDDGTRYLVGYYDHTVWMRLVEQGIRRGLEGQAMVKTQHCPNCEATEQKLHDFRQEVSNAVVCYFSGVELDTRLHRFIIHKPQPDPLVEVLDALKDGRAGPTTESYAHHIRAALDDLGFEIREKGQ
jgi:hypothetical protein